MNRHHQQGSAHVIVIVILVFALVGALGYIFYQNFGNNQLEKTVAKESTKVAVDENKDTTAKYIDFRKDGKDVSGIKVESTDDLAQLTGAGDKLKSYLTTNLGKMVSTFGGDPEPQHFVIDRLYGDYAVGVTNAVSAYQAWGPKGATGDIEGVAGTQDVAFGCEDLISAKVPSKLVDSKCYDTDGTVSTTYTQD